MTKPLIRKVERIKNYRIFQNWKPDGSVEFARVNLIYGQNGSGKSTFASLLAGCAANATTESESHSDSNDEANSGLRLLVTPNAGKSSFQVSLDDREFWVECEYSTKTSSTEAFGLRNQTGHLLRHS